MKKVHSSLSTYERDVVTLFVRHKIYEFPTPRQPHIGAEVIINTVRYKVHDFRTMDLEQLALLGDTLVLLEIEGYEVKAFMATDLPGEFARRTLKKGKPYLLFVPE